MTGERNPGTTNPAGADDPVADTAPPRGRGPRPAEGSEPLAALTGSGSSVVGVEGALRARDVSRPTAADLAAAATLAVRRATPRPGQD